MNFLIAYVRKGSELFPGANYFRAETLAAIWRSMSYIKAVCNNVLLKYGAEGCCRSQLSPEIESNSGTNVSSNWIQYHQNHGLSTHGLDSFHDATPHLEHENVRLRLSTGVGASIESPLLGRACLSYSRLLLTYKLQVTSHKHATELAPAYKLCLITHTRAQATHLTFSYLSQDMEWSVSCDQSHIRPTQSDKGDAYKSSADVHKMLVCLLLSRYLSWVDPWRDVSVSSIRISNLRH